jgi:D-lactate dehydrogenase (cytochrome)
MKYLRKELGHGVDVMQAVKTALDPKGIFNPGKILPAT